MKNKERIIAIPLVLSGLKLSENELKAPFFVTANKMADFKELNEKRLTENHPERFTSVRERRKRAVSTKGSGGKFNWEQAGWRAFAGIKKKKKILKV